MATVELKMSEEEFWACTPCKFYALIEVHTEIIKAKNGQEVEEETSINNIQL